MWLDKLLNDFFLFIKAGKFTLTANDKIQIFKALSYIDISDKKQLYSLLSAIIVKEHIQIKSFRDLFDIFFKNTDFKKKDNIKHADLNNSQSTGILESTLSSYKFNKYNYGTTLKYFILNNHNHLERLIRLAVSNIDSVTIKNPGNYFNNVKNFLGIDKIEEDINTFKEELIKKGASEEEVDLIINKIIRNLKNFKKRIRVQIKKEEAEHHTERNSYTSLHKIEIDNSNIEIMESASKKIIEKLNKKKRKKYKKSSDGILDIRKTVYKSVCYNQIPLKRSYKKQKKKKRNLIIFTDMSDSVKKHSQMTLYFIYSINKFFKEIKTFTFISDVNEITDIFKEKLNFRDFFYRINNKGGNSDYNSAFEIFLNHHENLLNKNTIFIIIGDARNNYQITDLKSLIRIRNKVKEIIWLNPESKFLWGTADSNMNIYQKIINKVYQIKTIEDMEKFSSEIIFK